MTKLGLIIDDENDLLEYLTEVLELLDVEVITATTGCEGIEKVDEHLNDLDLVFIDIFLKEDGKTGIDVYNHIRKRSETLPVIMMSGKPLSELTEDPNMFFLHKSFSFDDVEIMLNTVFK